MKNALSLEEAVACSERFFGPDTPPDFNPSFTIIKIFNSYSITTPALYRKSLERELFRCIKKESRIEPISPDESKYPTSAGWSRLFLSDFTDGLGEDLKEIVLLLYKGFLPSEIGDRLGVDRETVVRRIRTIRSILYPRFSSFL